MKLDAAFNQGLLKKGATIKLLEDAEIEYWEWEDNRFIQMEIEILSPSITEEKTI